MGTCLTKMASRKKQEKSFDDLRNSQTKMAASKEAEHVLHMPRSPKRSFLDEEADADIYRSSLDESMKKRKTLQELHLNPPLGFRKFESEVDWQTIDEEIALQLWEDVFKPLYTFCELYK